MVAGWCRPFVGVSAPPPDPRTETRTHLGIQTPVYTHHPSAGGAAQAHPFSTPGSGRYLVSFFCGARWPGSLQRREAGLIAAAAREVELGLEYKPAQAGWDAAAAMLGKDYMLAIILVNCDGVHGRALWEDWELRG